MFRNVANYPPKITTLITKRTECRIGVHYTDNSVAVVHGSNRRVRVRSRTEHTLAFRVTECYSRW